MCLVADDGGAGSDMVGACDLTLLPAGGAKKSKEGLVADVPAQLALAPDAHFVYLTGMVVPVAYRLRRTGQALLSKSSAGLDTSAFHHVILQSKHQLMTASISM